MSAVLVREPVRSAGSERSAKINIRATQHSRDLIERAAVVAGKTLTDFVLDSATQHAIDVLLDQRLFVLGETEHAAFMDALDNPPPAGQRLKALMRRKPRWET